MRALQTAVTVMERTNAPKRKQPENAGEKWTEHEIDDLIARFDSGMLPSKIAKLHGRTKTAIESKLMELGKLKNPYALKVMNSKQE